MNTLFLLVFLGLVAWVGGRFFYFYRTAEAKDRKGAMLEAAGDSAAYFAAKAQLLGSAILGLIATGGDYLATSQDGKASFAQFLSSYVTNPIGIAFAGVAISLLVWWATSRDRR